MDGATIIIFATVKVKDRIPKRHVWDRRHSVWLNSQTGETPHGPPGPGQGSQIMGSRWCVYMGTFVGPVFQPSATASVDNGVDGSTIIEGDQGELKGDIECLHTFACPHVCVSMRVLMILRVLDTRSGQFFFG